MKDKRVEMVINLFETLGAEIDIPEEYAEEKPNEEIIYKWDEVM